MLNKLIEIFFVPSREFDLYIGTRLSTHGLDLFEIAAEEHNDILYQPKNTEVHNFFHCSNSISR